MDDNFKNTVKSITDSGMSPDEKVNAMNELISGLNSLRHGAEIRHATEVGAVIADKAGRPEMAAQFCLMRAKAEIAEAGMHIGEMKNITMAIDWFEFGLETEMKRHKELDTKLQTTWRNTQAIIDMGYKLINKKPYVGAVAYCHRTAGEIYGQYYLQLKLHYFVPGRPWRARSGNLRLSRWLGMDDLFIMTKKSRTHLRKVRKDCLKSLHQAIGLFRREVAYAYVVETYFDLSLEHHSFNDPIRSKIYLWRGWLLMKWHKLSEPRLQKNFDSLRGLPLIGSDRTDDVTSQLRTKPG
jgi:hypothetical protein